MSYLVLFEADGSYLFRNTKEAIAFAEDRNIDQFKLEELDNGYIKLTIEEEE